MIPTDEPEFVRIVMGLSSQKPGKPLTPEGIELFWNSMQDWTIGEFREAANHLARSVEFMPNPYHFEQLRKAGRETTGEAFERARQIVRRLFPREYASHQSGDPKLDAAIRACGGYEALAMCTTENIGFFENRFREHYETISDAEEVRGALPDLTGGRKLAGPERAGLKLQVVR